MSGRLEEKSGNRIAWLDILRGIGIILMVYGHVCYSEYSYNWINSFHMAIFFFAAGYVCKKRPVAEDIRHRCRSLLIPYFVFGVLTLLYWYFAERLYKPSDETFFQAFAGLLRGQFETISFNVPLWFIPCFFLTMVVYNLLMHCCAKRLVYALTAVVTIIYIFVPFSPCVWGIDKIPRYLLFVAIGQICAGLGLDAAAERLHIALKSVIFLMLLGISLFLSTYVNIVGGRSVMKNEIIGDGGAWFWFVTAGIGCAACVMLALIFKHNRLLEYYGRGSMLVLCIHGAVYRILIQLTVMVTGRDMEGLRSSYIYSLLITAVTLGACALIREGLRWVRKRFI